MKIGLAVSFLLCVQQVFSLFCYWNSGCPYKYFSSKTPYNAVRGDIRDSVIKLTDCEPISIWGLFRYGKRQPGYDTSKNMRDVMTIRKLVVSSYLNGNSSLCAQDVDNLRDWLINSKLFENAYGLSDEGSQELQGIGSRLKQAFPNLLDNIKEGTYTIRSAPGKWMEDSAKGFVKGLQNINLNIDKPVPDFDVMAPYLTCGKYQKDAKKNPDTFKEIIKYRESSDYLSAKDRIQRRLGIDYTLTNENITALYDLCRYTWSENDGKLSPWCALFTSEDLKVLEYISDLRHYYRNGYGSPINEKFGHIPMTDLFENFERAKNGDTKKITAYFTHSTMLDMVYTSLNLFKDANPITGAHRDSNRKWRSSKSSVFAANIFAVLNKCNKNGKEEFNVIFYLNEEPLITICKEGVCTWQEFVEKFKPFLKTKIDFCEYKTIPYI